MKKGRRYLEKRGNSNLKKIAYLSAGTFLIVILTFFIMYIVYKVKINQINEDLQDSLEFAEIVPNTDILEEASQEMGKTIEEAKKENEELIEESSELPEEVSNEIVEKEVEKKVEEVEEVIPDPVFVYPVEGEIIREFAVDSLIYSETLQEWVTHNGIDIKAERTTVVKSAEKGTVTAIKEDPRYGLTIIIEHVNGYKTVYSNLLSTEFVKEGESVEQGQSIGTVGNSAPFEICDEAHLHFEILKDNSNINPETVIK